MSDNRVLLQQTYWPEDGKAQTDDKVDRAIRALTAIARDNEKVWMLVIRRYVKPKSPEQSGYLWGVVYQCISDATGFEREELHELMCGGFFGTVVKEIMGVKKRKPVRTTTTNELGEPDPLGTKEMSEFIDYVIRQAALHCDVIVPPPSTEPR